MTQTCKMIEPMLSGYLDGELTQQESQRVHVHLQQCAQCQALYDELKQCQQTVQQWEKPTMSEQQLKEILSDTPSKGFQWSGWVLLIGGLSVLIAVAVYQFLMAPDAPVWFKLTISSIVMGVVFLLMSVIRQRLISRKTDRYKGVDL